LAIGIASSRSRVPLERSRNVVTLVTRNMMMNGNSASSAGPIWSKISELVSSNIHHSSVISRHGTTSSIATVRWSRRSWSSTRPATAKVISMRARGAGRAAMVVAVVVMPPPPRS
jgi:hypothetical protein